MAPLGVEPVRVTRAQARKVLTDGVIAVKRQPVTAVTAADVAGVRERVRAYAEDACVEAERIAQAVAGLVIILETAFRIVIRHQVPWWVLHEAREEPRHRRLLRAPARAKIALAGPLPVRADAPARVSRGVRRVLAVKHLVKEATSRVGVEIMPKVPVVRLPPEVRPDVITGAAAKRVPAPVPLHREDASKAPKNEAVLRLQIPISILLNSKGLRPALPGQAPLGLLQAMAKPHVWQAPLMAKALSALHGRPANALVGPAPLTPAGQAAKPRMGVAPTKAGPARLGIVAQDVEVVPEANVGAGKPSAARRVKALERAAPRAAARPALPFLRVAEPLPPIP